MIHWCKCAEAFYRDNYDGTRDFTIKGESRCPMCHGSGYVAQCVDCDGAGVVRNAKCAACGGCGLRSKPAPAKLTNLRTRAASPPA
jgi:RecJ-like exonuclease